MSRVSVLLLLGFLMLGSGAVTAQEAMFLGNAERHRQAPDSSLAFVTHEAWSLQTGGSIRSTPLLHEGVVYVGSDDGMLYAVDQADGERIWTYDTGAPVGGSPVLADGRLYVQNNDNLLLALDPASGAVLWQQQGDGNLHHRGGWDLFASTPAVADGVLYAGMGDGSIRALDAATGALRWKVQTRGRVRSSPVVVGDSLIIGSFDGSVYRLHRDDGRELWRFYTDGAGLDFDDAGFDRTSVQSSPSVSGDHVVIGARDGGLYGLDLATGTQRWRVSHGMYWVVSTPLIRGSTAIVGSSDGGFITAVDVATGEEHWRTRLGRRVLSSFAMSGGYLLATSEDAYLHALDPDTGEVVWRVRIAGKSAASPTVGEGMVFVGSNAGQLQAFQARSRADSAGLAFYFEDEEGHHGVEPARYAEARERLTAAGYGEFGYETLAAHLSATLSREDPGVVVLLGEHLHPEVLDRSEGAPLLRRFMEAGGRVISMSGWPGAIVKGEDGKLQMDPDGPESLIGISMDQQSYDETRAVPTAAGLERGLSGWRMSVFGVDAEAVDRVLAIGDDGYAAGFEKVVGQGRFVRIPHQPDSDPDVDELLSIAEYRRR